MAEESDVPFEDILRGNVSFGSMFDSKGYTVVPSPSLPSPGSVLYYRGGYNTHIHGSLIGGTIDSIQIETPVELRSSPEIREKYAQTIAEAIDWYLMEYY